MNAFDRETKNVENEEAEGEAEEEAEEETEEVKDDFGGKSG